MSATFIIVFMQNPIGYTCRFLRSNKEQQHGSSHASHTVVSRFLCPYCYRSCLLALPSSVFVTTSNTTLHKHLRYISGSIYTIYLPRHRKICIHNSQASTRSIICVCATAETSSMRRLARRYGKSRSLFKLRSEMMADVCERRISLVVSTFDASVSFIYAYTVKQTA